MESVYEVRSLLEARPKQASAQSTAGTSPGWPASTPRRQGGVRTDWQNRQGLPAARARLVRGELAEEVDDAGLERPRGGSFVGEICRFEPDAAAALAGLVDQRVPLVLALDGEQRDVVDGA